MARYEVVTTVYDNAEEKELAQVTIEECDSLEDAIEEFETATGETFEECRLDGDGDDDDDEDEPAAADAAASPR